MESMATKKKTTTEPEFLCIVCSGGEMRHGAYTVCALCEINGLAPAAAA